MMKNLPAFWALVLLVFVPNLHAGSARLSFWNPDYETEVFVAPAPSDAAVREKAFAERNSPENTIRLAKEFFAQIDLSKIPALPKTSALDPMGRGEKHPDFQGRKITPQPTIAELVHQEKWAEALDAYRDFFFTRLISPPPGFEFRPISPEESYFIQFLHQPEELKNVGVARFPMVDENGKNAVVRIDMGPPGRVNWLWQPKGFVPQDSLIFPDPQSFVADSSKRVVFHKALLAEAVRTNNPAWTLKWCEFFDDRAMNLSRDLESAGLPAGELNPLEPRARVFNNLMWMAQRDPSMASDFPSTTLARILMDTFEVFPAMLRTVRAASNNRSIEQYLNPIQAFAVSLPEFKGSPYLLREVRRVIEAYPTVTMMPDGSDIENAEGYNHCYLRSVHHMLDVFKRQPGSLPWMGLDWRLELKDNLAMRTGYLIRRKGNLGMEWYPNHMNPTRMAGYYAGPSPQFAEYTAETLNDPVLKKIRTTLWEDGASGTPDFTSEFWPYSGRMVIREGWGKNDQHLHMDSGRPYNTHGWKHTNDIQLFAFGQALLSLHSDTYGYDRSGHAGDLWPWVLEFQEKTRAKYNNPDMRGLFQWEFTPLFVDGLPQMGHEAFEKQPLEYRSRQNGVFGKNNSNMAYQTPIKSRWHESERFNIAEGHFNGTFAAVDGSRLVEGVTHDRQLVFLRGIGLWIVVDRVDSANSHTYKLDWKPAQPFERDSIKWEGFRSHQVTGSDSDKSVKTSNPNTPNISIFMHSPAELKVSQFGAEFEGQGPQMVVSALFPRKTIKDELKSIETLPGEKGVSGFQAVTPDGTIILCQACADPAQGGALTAGSLTAVGEALIFVTRPDGTRYGVALGCQKLTLDGATQKLPSADFEFSLGNKKLTALQPIRRPMDRVEILPEADRFVDSLEITMRHNEPDTEIRYTLDGSQPSLDSPAYEKPVVLKATTTVKAAAFRKGLKKMSQTSSGTEVSAPLRVQYIKTPPLQPIAEKSLQPGLHYTYHEGGASLAGQMTRVPPASQSGVVQSPLELPYRSSNKSFAYDTTGFLKIPQDGVYTFHAPWELITPVRDAGFDLRLWLGGEEWYPATRWHNFGGWSVPLKKGLYPLRMFYVDQRGSNMWVSSGGQAVWRGDKPELLVSGPGLTKQPIPADWLWH